MIKWWTLVVAGIATFEEKRSHRFRRRNARDRVILLKPTTSVSDVRMGMRLEDEEGVYNPILST